MKKILLILTMTLTIMSGFSSSVFAYNEYEEEDEFYYNNIYGGYGFLSLPNMSTAFLELFVEGFSAAFTGDHKTVKDNGSFGPVFAGADYFLTENVSVGGIFAYEEIKRKWVYDNGTIVTGYTERDWSFLTLMGRLNLQWGWEYVKFYHSLMLGVSRCGYELDASDGSHRTDSDYIPGAHLVLVGIKIGKEFSVFADYGIGFLGMINFGASFSF